MKKNLTELVFILDESGSMSGLTADTIGGFNSLIAKQKKEEGEALVSTVFFSNSSKVIHDRVKLEDVPKFTDRDYVPSGCTALLDAVGDAVHHIANIHKYAREEDVPEKTLFVITTDGMENASRKYSHKDVRSSLKKRRRRRSTGSSYSSEPISMLLRQQALSVSVRNTQLITMLTAAVRKFFTKPLTVL